MPQSAASPSSPDPAPEISHETLAANLVARICHDLMSPVSGVVSGLDLLEDPNSKDLHGEAMALVAESARRLAALLVFQRAAYSPGAEAPPGPELESLARGGIAHGRAALVWDVDSGPLPGAAARALLILTQIGAAALPVGGRVRASSTVGGGWRMVSAEAEGGRVKLHPEVAAGLRGEGPGEGSAGRWAQAYWLHAHVRSAGGLLAVECEDERLRLRAAFPA
ncbi:MAG TPA: histidine phosphotransferase family protein [Caulobacteraceae bacterium]|nr:histidine phosphotransferase family protein [Caulobacteraceae bacterium]